MDETQFAGFANAIIDGGRPYIASVDTKPPGIYYFFAAIFFLFGRNNMIAIHAATIIWMWLTAIIPCHSSFNGGGCPSVAHGSSTG